MRLALGEWNGCAGCNRRSGSHDGGSTGIEHSATGDEDPVAVDETDGGETIIIAERILRLASDAVTIDVKVRRCLETHVNGRRLAVDVEQVVVRMPVFGAQVRRVEGAADGRQQVVRVGRVSAVRRVQRDQRPVVAVRSRRLPAHVAVLPPLLVAHVRALLVVMVATPTVPAITA